MLEYQYDFNPLTLGLSASGFISWFLEKYGDSSPERQKVLLPSCINVKYIYEEYRESPGPHLKEKHFYCVFRKNFGKVVSFAKVIHKYK